MGFDDRGGDHRCRHGEHGRPADLDRVVTVDGAVDLARTFGSATTRTATLDMEVVITATAQEAGQVAARPVLDALAGDSVR